MHWRCKAQGLVVIAVIFINPSFQTNYEPYLKIIQNSHKDKHIVCQRKQPLPTSPKNVLRQRYSDAFWNFNRIYFQSCQGHDLKPPCENCVDAVVSRKEGTNSTAKELGKLYDHMWTHIEWENPYTNAVFLFAKKQQPACIRRIVYTVKPPRTMQVGSAEQIYRAYQAKTLKRIYLSEDCSSAGVPNTEEQICGVAFLLIWDTAEEKCSLPVTSNFECEGEDRTCLMSESEPGNVFCSVNETGKNFF